MIKYKWWIRSYLPDRSYYVVINDYVLKKCGISSGIPQGSHLGPVLFNMFVNDIPNIFQHSVPFLYADNLKLDKVIEKVKDT